MSNDRPGRKTIPISQPAVEDPAAPALEEPVLVGPEALPVDEAPVDRVSELEAQVEAEKDRTLRAMAELQNYRRRAQEEASQRSLYANEAILFDLITVLEHFEMACEAGEVNEQTRMVCKGYEMILQQLRDVMGRYGLQEIPAEPGSLFDPALHEAVEGIAVDTPEEGTILRLLRKGYRLHDRILRPSQVAVAVRPE